MIAYPETLPIDGFTILINAVRNGLAPKGQHGDLACVLHAGWNVIGYAQHVAAPHDHDHSLLGSAGTGHLWTVADLPALLESAQVKTDNTVEFDWRLVVKLVLQLIQSLL
jgi:hypothetical protein